jgi:hypothetical protein
MNAILKKILARTSAFFSKKKNRRLFYLALISLFALGELLFSGLVRRTFVFYSNIEGNTVVEERMFRRSPNRETGIRRYVDEVLLGPVAPDSAPLFPRETRLHSFMYREAVVYADLSESAALPLPEGGNVFRSLLTLNEGVRRNFPYVKNVRLFIGGNEVFFEEFRGIFANPADNSKTPL